MRIKRNVMGGAGRPTSDLPEPHVGHVARRVLAMKP